MKTLKVEHHNVRPLCPETAVNPKKASRTEPQAWSHEINGETNWYYNWLGGMKETEFLGRKIPTIEQWMAIFENTPGGCVEKARTLGMPLSGYRNSSNGEYHDVGDCANRLSSSEKEGGISHYAVLYRDNILAYSSWRDRGNAAPISFLSE